MPTKHISLCMIVKDEEELLPHCLESVRGVVDEIIVVDTGSSDRSAAIAREHGAVVVPFVWSDDFAAARNAGLEQAVGEWILFLDADEALDETAREQIRSWTAASGCDGLFLNIHNYTGSGQQGITVNPVLRLFKNDLEHRFEGRIHEQIAVAICRKNPQAAFHVTDMVIHHYGYQTVIVERKDKVNRNLRLLQQAVEEEPEQPFHHYNLGVEYLRMGEAEQALKTFGVAKAGIDPTLTSYAHLLFKYEIRCFQHLSRWQEALDHIHAALELFPEYTDLLHHCGVCEEALGETEKAELSLREAVRMGPPPPIFHTEEGIGTYQTWYTLGRLLEGRADLEGAVDAYVEAVRAKSSLLPPLYRIFRIMRVSGQEQHLVELIKERFAITSEEAIQKVLGILEQCRCYDTAVQLLPDLSSHPSGQMRERISMAEALLQIQLGKWSKARLKLNTIQRKKGELSVSATHWIERLNWIEGRTIDGKDQLTAWLYGHSQPGSGSDVVSHPQTERSGSVGDAAKQAGSTGMPSTASEAAYDGWQALGLMMEGCVQSGKWDVLHALVQLSQGQLAEGAYPLVAGVRQGAEEQEPFHGASDSRVGTSWLVKGLVSAADHHLKAFAQEADRQRHRCWPVVQRIRLDLPGPDGFEF
ncbi:tetratricopeptide repeat-containing glycosyltransferase family 2 protein [Paenibacillus xylanivorans]|uniref:tetratricopeptide repeat-containing glycosyltransferase family 2 protein n=1 Tax=Paenibacillus xylanivorans TaxID=1705561 RepID=UPI000B1E3400|nr:glycosyltransferase [Paenibacillus xylanivorans]